MTIWRMSISCWIQKATNTHGYKYTFILYRVAIKETVTFNVTQYPNRHRSGHTICVVAQRRDENVFPGIVS